MAKGTDAKLSYSMLYKSLMCSEENFEIMCFEEGDKKLKKKFKMVYFNCCVKYEAMSLSERGILIDVH